MREIPKIRDKLFKIRGIAYLIQEKKLDELPPLDVEELNYGIGASMMVLAGSAMKQLNRLETRISKKEKSPKEPDEAGK